jgi:prepilin-type N-terminal cleavage/methylation domain-containing protein
MSGGVPVGCSDAAGLLAMRSNRRKSGFTLVEMLVVIAIIAVLVGLLLPAVQTARESGRRLQCGNNMRQMAMALQQHVTQHQRFPYGTLDDGSASVRCRDTWFQQCWPFLDQMPLYDQYMARTEEFVMDTPPQIKDAVIPTVRCPSDPQAGANGFGGGGPFRSGGWGFQGNYVGCASDDFIRINRTVGSASPLVKLSGIFFLDSSIAAAHIRDGLSNTLLLSEVRIREGKGGGWGDAGGYWGGGPHASFGFSARETPNSTVADRVYQCKTTADPRTPCVSVGDSLEKLNLARSYHAGGVTAAMADCSTHFFNDSIDVVVWRGLATRAGREPVNIP